MIRIATVVLLLYWIAIFAATHAPASALPGWQVPDKLYHVLAYGGLAFLLSWAIPTRRTLPRHACTVASIALAYGIVDELTQTFIPGRSCDAWDLAADAVGIGFGVAAYVVARQLLLVLPWGNRLIQCLSR